mmetsp:Transcript_8970/g.37018  ORF Transcript_8970/g.37018 Transcript_8970/m.37018 type:complete len:317 (+) Transcript_8970:118-1068(+)
MIMDILEVLEDLNAELAGEAGEALVHGEWEEGGDWDEILARRETIAAESDAAESFFRVWSAIKWVLIAINVLVTALIIQHRRRVDPGEAWALARDENTEKERVALVIAHPDDEAMFFAPFVSSAAAAGKEVFLLCLSTGNYDGLGAVRKQELGRSCEVLGVMAWECVDDKELQDGPKEAWPVPTVVARVRSFVEKHRCGTVLTFDDWGVSHHPNHISTFRGVREYLHEEKAVREEGKGGRNIQGFSLESTSIWRKYAGPLDALYSALASPYAYFTPLPSASFASMKAHHSQFVWFRWLFVCFSRYGYVNTFDPIVA